MKQVDWSQVRKIHRKIAPLLFLPLLISAATGVLYRIGRSWFQIPLAWANLLLNLHQGEYLGEKLVPVYVLSLGLGLLGLLVTGLVLFFRRNHPLRIALSSPSRRQIHRMAAILGAIPLFVSAITGIALRIGKDWLGLAPSQTALLLKIHQGSYWGDQGRPFYILWVGLTLGLLLGTGLPMTRIFSLPRRIR
ncbi:PepSY domain-containing protein [Lyngbya confervoides]|uniref:PepSY domain-containing protein n=1 Tax=Lyngbya confervoides BDU141951 TaxID=1574623 RepID=A0ABD4T5N0_9CYAN|nr:PepSY domain-containing protein [Lyngbya confervoides]MCM1983941.1 PepSY domain-containing protein [Lyngbya confervoides BDU141951]